MNLNTKLKNMSQQSIFSSILSWSFFSSILSNFLIEAVLCFNYLIWFDLMAALWISFFFLSSCYFFLSTAALYFSRKSRILNVGILHICSSLRSLLKSSLPLIVAFLIFFISLTCSFVNSGTVNHGLAVNLIAASFI